MTFRAPRVRGRKFSGVFVIFDFWSIVAGPSLTAGAWLEHKTLARGDSPTRGFHFVIIIAFDDYPAAQTTPEEI
jgi:hypothetical protein